jgi:CcmD family protein
MEMLLATYAIAWAVVSVYVIGLAAANARLARRLERLESLVGEPRTSDVPRARVA